MGGLRFHPVNPNSNSDMLDSDLQYYQNHTAIDNQQLNPNTIPNNTLANDVIGMNVASGMLVEATADAIDGRDTDTSMCTTEVYSVEDLTGSLGPDGTSGGVQLIRSSIDDVTTLQYEEVSATLTDEGVIVPHPSNHS